MDDYREVAGDQTWLKPGIPVAENGLKVGFHGPSQGSWQGAGREFFRCSPEISQVGRSQWCHISAPQEGPSCHAFLCLLLSAFSQLIACSGHRDAQESSLQSSRLWSYTINNFTLGLFRGIQVSFPLAVGPQLQK